MKITLIGTGAGEGYPGFWCECPHCSTARVRGGRDTRGNSCAMIDENILIDMNAYFFSAAPRMGIEVSKIDTLLVTHSHHDHFDPYYLLQRSMPQEYSMLSDEEKHKKISPNFSPLPNMEIYGNKYVEQTINNFPSLNNDPSLFRINFHLIREGIEEHHKGLSFLPIRSQHSELYGFAHNYILKKDDKTILYASDTGGYDEDMIELILNHKYDCIIMEGTFGLGAEVEGHMCLKKNKAFRKQLELNGCLKPKSRFYLTHICPHWTPPYDEYSPIVAAEGMILGYDGLCIEI